MTVVLLALLIPAVGSGLTASGAAEPQAKEEAKEEGKEEAKEEKD